MRKLYLFAFGVLVQAVFGVLALMVTRWGFRSWPTGSYTWIPGLIAVAGVIEIIWLGRALGSRGLPLPLLVAAWFIGRLLGAAASGLVLPDGIDAGLVAAASFNMLVIDNGQLALGALPALSMLLSITVLTLAHRWGISSESVSTQKNTPGH